MISPNNPSSQRPAIIEDIRASIRGIRMPAPRKTKSAPEPPDFSEARRLFTVCTGNRWMELGARVPPQKRLFGDFWHQNELCILFAAANAGKSILAVQIADALSRVRTAAPFAPRLKVPVKVLYIDFELSTVQFRTRYSQPGSEYNFSDNFFRAQFNADPALCPHPDLYDEFVIAAIEQKIELVKASVLIIDNLSCLRGGTENASVALRLMQNLKALQAAHHLSILVLAHTPKRRSPNRPLSADDLHGSKLLINFADSAFTIGASNSTRGLCYLKQIKQRNTEQVYGDNNVCLCRIARRGDAFLRFKFEGYSAEQPHLAGAIARKDRVTSKAAALFAKGFSQRQISKKLHISLGLVNKLLKDVQTTHKKSHPQPGWGPHQTGSPLTGSPLTGIPSPAHPSRGDLAREVPNAVGDDSVFLLENKDDAQITNKKSHAELGWRPLHTGSPLTGNPLTGIPSPAHPSRCDLAREVPNQVGDDLGDILANEERVRMGDSPPDRHREEQPVPTQFGKATATQDIQRNQMPPG